MRQRRHPEATWAQPYQWAEVLLDDLTDLGGLRAVQRHGHGLEANFARGSCLAAAVAPGIFRLDWSDAAGRSMALPAGSAAVVLAEGARDPDAVVQGQTVVSGGGRLEFGGNGVLRLTHVDGRTALSFDRLAMAPAEPGLRICADFILAAGEVLHGFGGRTGPVQRRGHTCDQFSVKVDGPKNGDYGGLPMPWCLSSAGYGLFLDNPWPHVYADLGYTDPNCMRWTTPAGPSRMYLIVGDTPATILQRWHQLTGAPALPPPWYFGLWMSWCASRTASDWRGWIDRFRAEGWPLDIAVLDLEWRGGHLSFNQEGGDGDNLGWAAAFGDGAALMRHAEEQGVHICLHLNTRQFSGDIRRRGLAEGWLRVEAEQTVVQTERPEWVESAWALHAPRVEEGCAVWWTDNGERVDGTLGDGLPSRNLFGQRWNRFLYQGMQRHGLDGRLVLTRGDWAGAQRHATPWPGDDCPGVDRHDEVIRWILNCAVSGVPFSGSDLGGYRSGKDYGEESMHGRQFGVENLVRRVVHGFLFQPIARVHGTGPRGKFPWEMPPKVQRLWRLYLGLRYRLMLFWRSAAIAACRHGIPLARPLWFDFPDDATAHTIEDQLLIGDGLLVAPMVRDAAHERRVYLPAGDWYHYWTHERLSGGRFHVVDAPLWEDAGLPLFVRAGACLIYGSETDRVNPAVETLEIVHYPGPDRICQCHLDPGQMLTIASRTDGAQTVFTMDCGRSLDISVRRSDTQRTTTMRLQPGRPTVCRI